MVSKMIAKDINTKMDEIPNAPNPTSPDAGACDARSVVAYELGSSTFHGNPMRGGWIPIFYKHNSDRPTIGDWLCPTCKRLTGNSRSCPHCGLLVLERPRKKPSSIRNMRSWSKWSLETFEDGRQPGCSASAFRETNYSKRAGSRSHNIIHRSTAP